MAADSGFLRSGRLFLRDCADRKEFVTAQCEGLQNLNAVLEKAGAHVGYRVRDEIVFYLLANAEAGNPITYAQALDNAVMQKILPRLQGGSEALRGALSGLFAKVAGDTAQAAGETESARMLAVIGTLEASAEGGRPAGAARVYCPRSARKIAQMTARLEEDGFTTYWI